MKKKKILVIFILIISYIIINLICGNKSYAAINQSMSTDINSIDSSKYPQIKEMLKSLKSAHPNWNFKILYTDIEWSEAIANEYVGHGKSPRNLVPANNSNYDGDWICKACGAEQTYDSGKWHCASEAAIAYMMDPRNSANYTDIFQFLQLSYSECNMGTIKAMVNGTFLNESESYINAIVDAAKQFDVNPYYIVARIIQEQGKDGSVLSKGQGYNGEYVGYYNVFNIGASGNGKETVILNGFKKAQEYGWTSMEKAIKGGVEIIAKSYISKGQDTLYFQKFDVENSDGNVYWHQYMQNLLAAQKEGQTLRKTFEGVGSVNADYTFIIPLYKNMPGTAAARPSSTSSGEIPEYTELVRVNVDNDLRLRNAPNGSGTVGWVHKDEIITRLEMATSKVGGTYWDYVMKSDGTKGYAARETYDYESKYKLYLVPVAIDTPAEPGKPEKPGEEQPAKGGDVTGDGKIDSMDMYNIIQYILGNLQLNDNQKTAADMNGDKKIDSMDMYLVIQEIIKE